MKTTKRSQNGAGTTGETIAVVPGPDGQFEGRRRKSKAPAFRPALFAACRDLAALRYDYPLVLTWNGPEAEIHSLSSLIDRTLQQIAPRGAAGERQRCHLLRLEEGIRRLVSDKGKQDLAKAWEVAGQRLLNGADTADRSELEKDLAEAGLAFKPSGDAIACAAAAATEVIVHLWRGAEANKSRAFFRRVDRLVHQLENMLEADAMTSSAAWEPDSLEHTMGGAFAAAFDFAALGDAIKSVACRSSLPEARKERVRKALTVLKSQQLFKRADSSFAGFLFESLDDALEAQEARLDEIAGVLRAVGVAELEISNRYREGVHDEALESFDRSPLKPEEIAHFPSSLVLLRSVRDPAEVARVLEALGAGLPLKVVLVHDDLVEDSALAARVADMAMALNEVFVLQTASFQLGRTTERMRRGLAAPGPALFNLFSGGAGGLPPYLVAALAAESRAFPSFSFDPAAGREWADRFHVGQNPQPTRPWPVHPFAYEEARHRKLSEAVAVTWIDFAGCDRSFDTRFETIPPSEWKADMLPVADYLNLAGEDRAGWRPYILAIDEQNRLWRRIPDEKLIAAAARCAQRWRSLQELGGIDNSHAGRLLAREQARWNVEKEEELRQLRERVADAPDRSAAPAEATVASPASADSSLSEAAAQPESPKSEEAYIESPRCTSCEECVKINNRMFAYNGNKQAYITDPDAGPYADLVRAAEACQVCIIHPGKPRNPAEPDLDALLKRAEPFL